MFRVSVLSVLGAMRHEVVALLYFSRLLAAKTALKNRLGKEQRAPRAWHFRNRYSGQGGLSGPVVHCLFSSEELRIIILQTISVYA